MNPTDSIIRFFGLPGSWKWACRQMEKGRIVRRSTDTGTAKYRLDLEAQRRIVWSYKSNPPNDSEWETAYIFLRDFECVKWVII